MNNPKNCNCGKKVAKDAIEIQSERVVKKVLVSCPDCDSALIAENGMSFPLHKARAIVPQSQFEKWVSEGHSVIEVSA